MPYSYLGAEAVLGSQPLPVAARVQAPERQPADENVDEDAHAREGADEGGRGPDAAVDEEIDEAALVASGGVTHVQGPARVKHVGDGAHAEAGTAADGAAKAAVVAAVAAWEGEGKNGSA